MEYEPQTLPRTPTPVFCLSCGASISSATAGCVLCAVANPAAQCAVAYEFGTSPEEPLPHEVLRVSTPSNGLPSPESTRLCAVCNATLGPTSKFCRNCGAAVSGTIHLSLSMSTPEREPGSREVGSGQQIPPASLDDDSEDLTPPSTLPELDYLDAQLGLKASDIKPALTPMSPAWRQRRFHAQAEEAHGLPPEDSAVPVSRAPHTSRLSATASSSVPEAIGLEAAVDLKVQIRAVEWLLTGILLALAGIFMALVGLLLKL
jgi:hypothetical protein